MDSSIPPPPTVPIGQICLSVYSWISFVFYAALIYLLIRYRRNELFCSPFFSIVVYNSIADFALFFHIELCMRPRKYRFFGMFSEVPPEWFGYYSYFLLTYLRNCISIGYLLIAFNRYTAFRHPLLHRTIWTSYSIKIATGFIWFFVFLCHVVAFITVDHEIYFAIQPDGVQQMFITGILAVMVYMSSILSVLVVLFCTTFYLNIGYYSLLVRKYKQKVSNAHHVEMKLLFCSILTFTTLVIEMIRYFFDIYGVHYDISVFIISTEVWFYTNEITTSIQCWTLLVTSSRLRVLVFTLLFRGRKKADDIVKTLIQKRSSIFTL